MKYKVVMQRGYGHITYIITDDLEGKWENSQSRLHKTNRFDRLYTIIKHGKLKYDDKEIRLVRHNLPHSLIEKIKRKAFINDIWYSNRFNRW